MADARRRPEPINPLSPADLVIDHSVQVDVFGDRDAFARNAELEFERNEERYAFLRWGQRRSTSSASCRRTPASCHQVNLEYLARVVFARDGRRRAYPDTLVGTDSHTTMINGLGVRRLGRRRHRGRGGHARPAALHAHPRRSSASS